jgi:hypothetical protein
VTDPGLGPLDVNDDNDDDHDDLDAADDHDDVDGPFLSAARTMHTFTSNDGPNLDELRVRLRKMSDPELLRYGKAARFMSAGDWGKPPRQSFVIQLRECREEWKRRHPKPPLESST